MSCDESRDQCMPRWLHHPAAALARALPRRQARSEIRWITQELPKQLWRSAVLRRARHEPLQYILGSQPFGPLDIKCKPGVLIPRWETAEWVTKAARVLQGQPLKVFDACTGTGCIPLLLQHHLKGDFTACDVSEAALELARENCASAVDVKRLDVLSEKVEGHFTLVTANPPYIPLDDYMKPVAENGVERSVRQEPKLALVGNLEFYRALVENVVLPLRCSGFVFEVGYESQVEETQGLLPDWQTKPYRDSAGRIRCVVGWKPNSPMEVLKHM